VTFHRLVYCSFSLSFLSFSPLDLPDNVGPGGNLNKDRFMRALMQYRNTPMQDSRRSPAQMLFGRQMQDFLPALPHKYEPAKDWSVTQENRERTLAKKRDSYYKKWREKTKDLEDIEIGTPVAIQTKPAITQTSGTRQALFWRTNPIPKFLSEWTDPGE
jgi:hypothetical protein